MRRMALAVLGGVLWLATVPAQAKMPPFDLEVGVAGTEVTVTVTLDPEVGYPGGTGLVAIYPGEAVTADLRPRGRQGRVDVDLQVVGPGAFSATMDLGEAGEWVAVPFPDAVTSSEILHRQGYPEPVGFSTVERSSPAPLLLASAAGFVALLVGFGRRRRLLAVAAAAGLSGIALVSFHPFTATAGQDLVCEVTIPPADVPGLPESPYPHLAWYGTADLYTLLPTDGSYLPRKSVWWSVHFPGGAEEPEPPISVTWERLDADSGTHRHEVGTNAYTVEDGWFMISGIDPLASGCWQVTADYKGHRLSYVYRSS